MKRASRRHAAGLSLPELMVALAIGVPTYVFVAAAVGVVWGTATSLRALRWATLGADVVPADVTTEGLLRAAAPQLADPSSAAPLVPLYLRRPDAVPPASYKPVTTA